MLRFSVLPLLLLANLFPSSARAATEPASTPAATAAGAEEQPELPAPAVRQEVLDARQAMQVAADALKQREAQLLATNEVIRSIVARRDKAVGEREELMRSLPELKEKQEAVALAEKEVEQIKADPATPVGQGDERLRDAKRKLLGLRKELNQLRLGGSSETPDIRRLRQQEADAFKDINLAMHKDARYAELRRAFNIAHLDYQRVALPLPKMPDAVVQKALEDASTKPVESVPDVPGVPRPVPGSAPTPAPVPEAPGTPVSPTRP